jgi:proline dehydrogenase
VSLLGRLVLAVTRRGLVERLFTRGGWGRRVATRFVAGETLDEAVGVVRELNAGGFRVSLDHLGEHVSDARLAAQALDAYRACLDRIAGEQLDANISVKLTQLGLGVDETLVTRGLDDLAARAEPFEFQMLFGIRTSLQQELLAAGYPMRVYVPYGDAWYPYLTRRIAERPANVWFFARALLGR